MILKTPIDRLAQLEVKVYNNQYEYIKERFGMRSADHADYGNHIEELNGVFRISTTVHGQGILTSVATFNSTEIPMKFEQFSE